jgi:hypothetical protein
MSKTAEPEALNLDTLASTMVDAAKGAFAEHWPEVARFAEREFRQLANRILQIAGDVTQGIYDEPTGRMLIAMQRNVAAQAIAGLTTLTLLLVERAMNRALEALRQLVGGAVRGLL